MEITQILHNGQPVKSGQGKKGPWEMFEVELDSGDTATLFGPVKVGMDVETYEHETYGLQYRVKRISLDQIYEEIQSHTKILKWIVNKLKEPAQTQSSVSRPEPVEDPDDLAGLFDE